MGYVMVVICIFLPFFWSLPFMIAGAYEILRKVAEEQIEEGEELTVSKTIKLGIKGIAKQREDRKAGDNRDSEQQTS